MPTCPGCGLNVPYQQLDTHEQYCEELTADEDHAVSSEELDRRLAEMEQRINGRIRAIEATIQAELSDRRGSKERNGHNDRFRK